MRKTVLSLLGLLLLAGQGTIMGRAQSAATAKLSLVDAQGFPTVEALLDVFDEQGQPITNLKLEDVTMMEDGQPFPVIELTKSTPPVQIVVAVNPGPALAVRDTKGIERFKPVTEILTTWADKLSLGDIPDDLSLVTIAGPIITHATPQDWIISLTSFQPDFRSTTPNVQTLAMALNTVNEPVPVPGMKRAILFITPHMVEPNIDLTLQDFGEQALGAGVRIFVWLVDADIYFNHPSAIAFEALALQTGGNYFEFSGSESFPDLETYFAPLRHQYSLRYNSTQTSSGEHSLVAEVQSSAGTLTSNSQTFNLDVQPPNPILVSPPAQIVRQAPQDDPFNTELLLPEEQSLEIIIEFPDNHTRPLARTTLYVDGQPVAQNDSEPFDTFTWDLKDYDESGVHILVVEAVDSLGMSKTSMEKSVNLTVVQAPRGVQAFLAKYRGQIAVLAIGLAGIVLVSILLYGRLRFRSRSERREARKRKIDPVTQPVPIQQAEPLSNRKGSKGKQATRLSWMRSNRLPDAPAYLTRLSDKGEPITGHPIPLTEKENTFGIDPVQSGNVLDHPSIAALHARINRTAGGDFLLLDNDSVAGTWVNYDPIPKAGHILKHGDVVNFGQLIYRFTLKKAPPEAEPKVTPEADSE